MRKLSARFQPAGDKSLKRQVLSHAMRTGDSLKSFGVDDFYKAGYGRRGVYCRCGAA
jgi:hypothetical protein